MVDPLEDPKSAEELAEEARAEKIQKRLKLRDECRFVLELPAFMEMLRNGKEAAASAAERATDEMKPLEIIQRHTGAKIAIRDLIGDIKRMAAFKVPVRGEKPKIMGTGGR